MYEDHYELVNGISIGNDFNAITLHTNTEEHASEVLSDLTEARPEWDNRLSVDGCSVIFQSHAVLDEKEGFEAVMGALKETMQLFTVVSLHDKNAHIAASELLQRHSFLHENERMFAKGTTYPSQTLGPHQTLPVLAT